MSRYPVALFILCLVSFSSAKAAERPTKDWISAKVTQEGADVYRQSDRSSEIIGHYPLGTKLTVFSKDKNSFYLIHFNEKWERTEFGWVPVQTVELLAPDPAEKPYGPDKETFRWKHRFRLGAAFNQYSPSDFQTNLETTVGTFNGLSYSFEYERHFSSTSLLAFYATVQRYNFSQLAPGALVSQQGSYSLTGNAALLGLSLSFYSSKKFRLAMTVGGGISLNNEQSTGATASLSTSTLLGYPILGQLMGEIGFFPGFEGYLKIGYQIESLNSLPVVPLSSTSQEVVNSTFSLNAPFVGIGIGWIL